MPTSAQPVEQHGDSTPLSIGADLSSALLQIPLEIWLHIFDDEIKITDLTHLRSISKTFWVVAKRLMPHVAARMHPSHANDPRINDSFFAEALIAAHRLNVQSPLAVLLRRDGSLDSAMPDANSLLSTQGHASTASNSERRADDADAQEGVAHPTRSDWIIGSRRTLHLAQVQGHPSQFGICTSCEEGECRLCLKCSNTLQQYVPSQSDRREGTRRATSQHSRAIFGSDGRFCTRCLKAGESSSAALGRGANTITIECRSK